MLQSESQAKQKFFSTHLQRKAVVGVHKYPTKAGQPSQIMAQNSNNTISKFNVTFGILSHDNVPANAAVLLNECKKRINGELQSVTEFLAIEGVKSTKETDLIVPVLAVMLADTRERAGFASEYKVCILDGAETDSKIRAKSLFSKYLRSNVVYKSNSEGALNKALVLDDGLRLSGTSLKVTEKQPIFAAKGNELRVIMHQTAEAVCRQATMRKDIIGKAKAIYTTAYEEAAPKAEVKVAKKASEPARATA